LLAVLAFAVLGMHSVVAWHAADHGMAPPSAAAVMAPGCCPGHDGGQAPGHDHQWLHLCLAVITQLALGAALLMLTAFAWLLRKATREHLRRWSRPPARAPDPPVETGRALLTSVCVLRL
jgi:hypothetical protein